MENITNEILNGVGKKVRNGYLAGKISSNKVIEYYKKNIKEADAFSDYDRTIFELLNIEKETHNPILKIRVQQSILEHKEKSRKSNEQNKLSIEKLETFRTTALGIGLRKVITTLQKIVRQTSDTNAEALLLLLELEFANLSAKKLHKLKEQIYERKTILLKKLSFILPDLGWKYGLSYNTGKNSAYIIYIYLPNGEQLSWHCNEYNLAYCFPEIETEWDGQVCMTMDKILNFIHTTYDIGSSSVCAQVA